MKKLYVRIHQKQAAASFCRCGIKFTKAWQLLEAVDAATAARLEAEQMLEVSETKPADLEDEMPNEADPSGTSTTALVSGTPAAAPNSGAPAAPEDPVIRLEAIRAAIAQLDKEDDTLWTGAGKPKTEAIAAITGWPVTAAERDAALVEVGEQ
ncbi:hypothetical protein ACLSSQ_11625 [Azospira sp. APE16]|uniref:hypothetical protein n=1 Tax=Azospira sp. APE16 TaxID=3394231 RepID=UPI003A4E4854